METTLEYKVNCALVITIPLLLALVELIGGKRNLELGATVNIINDLTIFGTLCYYCEHLIPELSALRMEKNEYYY